MGVGFVLLAGCASIHIFLDELIHTWPPMSGSDELFGFEISRVAGCLMIMKFFDKIKSKVVLVGDINSSLV